MLLLLVLRGLTVSETHAPIVARLLGVVKGDELTRYSVVWIDVGDATRVIGVGRGRVDTDGTAVLRGYSVLVLAVERVTIGVDLP